MAAEKHGHERQFPTPRYLDPQKDPPEYVDLELPTLTIKLLGPGRRPSVRAPQGSVEQTYRITGSYYDLSPGTYSLRITRMNIGVLGESGAGTAPGGVGFAGTVYSFHMRHSRDGTIFQTAFDKPEMRILRGDGLNPILSVGPGTLSWGFDELTPGAMGTRVDFIHQSEGLLG